MSYVEDVGEEHFTSEKEDVLLADMAKVLK